MAARTRKGPTSAPRKPTSQPSAARQTRKETPTEPAPRSNRGTGGYGLAGWTGAQPEIEKPTKSAQAIADRELARVRGKKK